MTITYHTFVYGSLMFPAVYEAITGTVPNMVSARLPGFRRYAVGDGESTPYPAIVPSPGDAVAGKLVREVTPANLAVLDRFEETERGLYVRRRVTVEGPSGPIDAETYVASNELRTKITGDWDPARFEKLWMSHFLRGEVAAFRAEERARLKEDQD